MMTRLIMLLGIVFVSTFEVLAETRILNPQTCKQDGVYAKCKLTNGKAVYLTEEEYRGAQMMVMQMARQGKRSAQTAIPLPDHIGRDRKDSDQPSKEHIAFAKSLDQVLVEDSKSWTFNVYKHGSVENVTVLRRDQNGDALVAANYLYNTTQVGIVNVLFNSDGVECIAFHDNQNCRSIGETPSSKIVAAYANMVSQMTVEDFVGSPGKTCIHMEAIPVNGRMRPICREWR